MELYIKTEWIQGHEKKQYQEDRDKAGPSKQIHWSRKTLVLYNFKSSVVGVTMITSGLPLTCSSVQTNNVNLQN